MNHSTFFGLRAQIANSEEKEKSKFFISIKLTGNHVTVVIISSLKRIIMLAPD